MNKNMKRIGHHNVRALAVSQKITCNIPKYLLSSSNEEKKRFGQLYRNKSTNGSLLSFHSYVWTKCGILRYLVRYCAIIWAQCCIKWHSHRMEHNGISRRVFRLTTSDSSIKKCKADYVKRWTNPEIVQQPKCIHLVHAYTDQNFKRKHMEYARNNAFQNYCKMNQIIRALRLMVAASLTR